MPAVAAAVAAARVAERIAPDCGPARGLMGPAKLDPASLPLRHLAMAGRGASTRPTDATMAMALCMATPPPERDAALRMGAAAVLHPGTEPLPPQTSSCMFTDPRPRRGSGATCCLPTRPTGNTGRRRSHIAGATSIAGRATAPPAGALSRWRPTTAAIRTAARIGAQRAVDAALSGGSSAPSRRRAEPPSAPSSRLRGRRLGVGAMPAIDASAALARPHKSSSSSAPATCDDSRRITAAAAADATVDPLPRASTRRIVDGAIAAAAAADAAPSRRTAPPAHVGIGTTLHATAGRAVTAD